MKTILAMYSMIIPMFIGNTTPKTVIIQEEVTIQETELERLKRLTGVEFGDKKCNTIGNERKVQAYLDELDRRIKHRRDSLRKTLSI